MFESARECETCEGEDQWLLMGNVHSGWGMQRKGT